MATVEFKLPELGENIAAGDVLRVLVRPGDTVARDQPVIELETDKATIEVPSSVGGTVREVKVKEGDKVQVGQVVFVAEGDASGQGPAAEPTVEHLSTTTPPARAGADADEDDQEAPGAAAAEQSGATAGDAEVEAEDRTEDAREGGAGTAPPRDAPPADASESGGAAAGAPAGPVEFALPELGENIPGGDVVRVLVKQGETIARDQPVLELETDKATIEVPSSVGGVVREIRVKEGDKVSVGQAVLVVEGGDGGAVRAAPAAAAPARDEAAAPTGEGAAAPAPRAAAPSRAPAAGRAPAAAPVHEDDEWPAREEAEAFESTTPPDFDTASGGLDQRVPGRVRRGAPDKPGMHEEALAEAAADAPPRPRADVVSITRGARTGGEAAPARALVPAAPSVRRVARELGVDIAQVTGTGPGGRISADDVKAHVKRVMQAGGPAGAAVPAAAPATAPSAPAPLPDFAKWGEIERKPMRAVRRKTAEHLSRAWVQIPHVTQFDKADITALEELRKRYGKRVEAGGGKLTVTAVALKVVAAALKTFPQFNAAIDMAADEIVHKKYVHVGVAVDTDRGLIVPVIRDVDRKNVTQLAKELADLSEKARTGKTTLDEMQGGCFTITNLGGIGGTMFTPIVNLPEVAILGMSRSAMEPVYVDGQFQPRLMLPLSLSYDHRAIDGADAIRFLRWVCEALEQPFKVMLEG